MRISKSILSHKKQRSHATLYYIFSFNCSHLLISPMPEDIENLTEHFKKAHNCYGLFYC
jgi:hypothetical protein